MKIEEREGKKESEEKTKRRKRRKEETREKWRREREEKERNGEERKRRRKHLRKVELITGQWLSGMDSVRKVVNQHTHRKRIT